MLIFLFACALGWAASFDELVASPLSVLRADANTPGGFRIVALSNLAEACMHRRAAGTMELQPAQACVRRAADAAVHASVAPWPTPPEQGVDLGEHGLYLSHLGVVLGAYEAVVDDQAHTALAGRVAEHLAHKSMVHSTPIARSYPALSSRWPADQAVTLRALHLHDQGYGTALAAEPTTRWLAFMEAEGTEPVWLLHRSELTGADATSALPRGCALSWTVRYMASFAPAQAEVLWRRYRAHFQVTKGPVTGFREWPPGVEGAADSDSGPIVYGIGSSATAFAIGASRAVGDMETYRRLAATERITWTLAAGMGGALGEAADSALATAIHANQHSLPGPL